MDITVIGVAGGTGSGKSRLVKRLQEAFKDDDVATICHDYYYKAHPELTYEERTKLNYDHPKAFDTDMMVEHIKALKSNVPGERPVYSFVEHNRTEEKVMVKPSKVIIVDGILIIVNNIRLRVRTVFQPVLHNGIFRMSSWRHLHWQEKKVYRSISFINSFIRPYLQKKCVRYGMCKDLGGGYRKTYRRKPD